MNLWLYALAAALAFGAGWQTRSWKADADRLAQVQADAKDAFRRAERVDVAATGYETNRAATAERVRVIYREVSRVTSQPFYSRDAPACLDTDGLRAVTQALGAADAASSPAPAVPAASAAR